ncbi:MAG: lamin tail domain-containing protein [bacterium]
MICKAIYAICLSLIPFMSVSAQLVLSEIMYNPYNDYYEEFIEIYNPSSLDTIDLAGYLVGDQLEQDSILALDSVLILLPQQYAVILDAGYWENSLIYNYLIPDDALVLTINDGAFGSGGLRNSEPADTVKLIDPTGEVVAAYSYSLGNIDGISEEKILLSGDDSPENWANSHVPLGTPGFLNSVTPMGTDLGIRDLEISPAPQPFGEQVQFAAKVDNFGSNLEVDVEVIFGIGGASAIEPDSVLESEYIPEIASQDSEQVSLVLDYLPPGPHQIFAWLTISDDDSTNNLIGTAHLVGYPEMALVINEIMAAPLEDQAEWIELYNPSDTPVDVLQWMMADANLAEKRFITLGSVTIEPLEYCLLAQDSSIFETIPELVSNIIVPPSWPVLNNSGDSVAIFDAAEELIDLTPFDEQFIEQGISLERIYPEGASDDPDNWQLCYDSTGSTPGQSNSYGSPPEPQGSEGNLTLSPDPFDPDQHGTMEIEITMPLSAASVRVSAFDLRGRKLLTIFDGNLAPNPLLWDGRDQDHRRLIPGPYIMLVEFRDQNAVRDTIIKQAFIIAGRL